MSPSWGQKFIRIDHPSCNVIASSSDKLEGVGTFVVGRATGCYPTGQETFFNNYIALIDSNGLIQWQKSIDLHSVGFLSKPCERSVDVIWTKDSCALVAMNSTVQADFGIGVWAYDAVLISKWDRWGNNIWANKYSFGKTFYEHIDIQEVNDSLYHIPLNHTDSIATYLEFNSHGLVTDTFALRFSDTSYFQYDNFSSLSHLSGERLFCGEIGANRDLVLCKTSGNIIDWSRRIEFSENHYPLSIVQSNSKSSIYVLGGTVGSNFTYSVTKLNASGNVMWSSGLGSGHHCAKIILYNEYVIIPECVNYIHLLDTLDGTNLSTISIFYDKHDPDPIESINNFKIANKKMHLTGMLITPSTDQTSVNGFIMESNDSLMFCRDSISQSYTVPLSYTYHTINPIMESIPLQVHPYSFTIDTLQELFTIDQCSIHLDVSDKKANKLRVYPNPTHDHLNINVGIGKQGLLQVYNVSGQLVFYSNVLENITLNTSEWKSGLYTIVLHDEGGSVLHERFIKLD